MITIEKKVDLPVTYPLETIGKLNELLFFDIETTGFSGDYSTLYLIGCTYYRDGSWHLIQWFADTLNAEEELLHAFFAFMEHYRYLIHFNGDGFDIPYLLKRCRAYDLDYGFLNIKSVDIYKIIKPYKKLLGLENLKQKSIECFLGVCREDKYNGGQLIEGYKDYLATRDEFLYNLLILHNEDDLKGMPSILPVLYYHDFLRGGFAYTGHQLCNISDAFGSVEQELKLCYKSPVPLPVPVQWELPPFTLELSDRLLTVSVPLYQGELKHFYPDYQNYVYLVYEDNAIHKSVGQYVEKDAKKKATAKTCYTRVSGIFLPQPCEIWDGCVKSDYKAKTSYVMFRPELLEEEGAAARYLDGVLKHILN